MNRGLILALLIASRAAGALAVTNTLIVSDVVELKAWRRDYPSVENGTRINDASGKIVAAADAQAIQYVAENAAEIADAATDGLTNSVADLMSATNGMPNRVESFSVQFIRKSPANLMGHIVANWFDGTNDWHAVRYSKHIAKAPKRKIHYTTPSGEVTSDCSWINWTSAGITTNGWGGVHICKAERPADLRNKRIMPIIRDVFGGSNGFDFGSMSVFIDGEPTCTGSFTGLTTRAVLTIDNGVIKSWE